MRILALDAALARLSATLVTDGVLVCARMAAPVRGQQGMLAAMAADVLDGHSFDAVAVTVGPGSFTGLRGAIALAHGLATGGRKVIGVTVAEALADAVGPTDGRTLWTAIASRPGRVFLDIDGRLAGHALSGLPHPPGPVAVAGDAAIAVAAILAGRGFDVRLTDARLPLGAGVAAVASRRLAGLIAPLEAQPLYVDPPEARLPAGGLRPPPLA